jgi:hypothetical protein
VIRLERCNEKPRIRTIERVNLCIEPHGEIEEIIPGVTDGVSIDLTGEVPGYSGLC